MLVNLADSGKSLRIRTDGAASVSDGVQGQQAQVMAFLLEVFLGSHEN